MNRRDFLLGSSGLLLAGLASPGRLPAQAPAAVPPGKPSPTPTGLVPLRRHVGLYNSGTGSTIGWLSSPDGIVVVDSLFPKPSADLLGLLPGRNGRTVDVLINSHHHPDHVGGNAAFRPLTRRIVAHENVPEYQLAQAAERGTTAYQVVADTLFKDSWKAEIGDETVVARYIGYPAHTISDSVVHFEKANVVFLADLVFNRYYPMTDRPGGVVIKDWIRALEQVIRDYPADAIYVFGHARNNFPLTGTPRDVATMRDYLTALLEFTDQAIKSGRSRDEHIGGQELPGFPEWRAPQPNFIARNFAAAWDELTGAPRPKYQTAVSQLFKAT